MGNKTGTRNWNRKPAMQQAQLTAQSSTPHKRPSLVVYCDGEGRKRHRKVSSKLATTCAEETAAQEQKDVSKQSQVHIEHVKRSVKSSHYLSATGPNSTGSMPPQFIINSSPPLPTGYQLPTQLSPPLWLPFLPPLGPLQETHTMSSVSSDVNGLE